jgi:hypothetical protein
MAREERFTGNGNRYVPRGRAIGPFFGTPRPLRQEIHTFEESTHRRLPNF